MAIVTFMSDYGWQDHYVAAVKAAILRESADLNIVDLSHNINPFDISHAAYVLKNVFKSFPEGTVHLVSVDPVHRDEPRYVAAQLENHFFVGNDSGLFSLISSAQPSAVVSIDTEGKQSTFPCKDFLAPVAGRLAKGTNIGSIGNALPGLDVRLARQVKANKREIVGHVIRVDHYGNLITNITRTDFEAIIKINGGGGFDIYVGREVFQSLNEHYHEVDSGNCFLIFNSAGLLQVGINKGNASELLGMKLDTPVVVEFK